MPRTVMIDPDGTCHSYLGVIVRHPTGIVYRQQCGGIETLERSAEGYFVPLGGATFDASQGRLLSVGLTAVFHDQGGCVFGGMSYVGYPAFPPERLAQLRLQVEAIPYWSVAESGDTEQRVPLQLDESRLSDLLEAWVPVVTPHGPAVLTWPNCD
jgi:hypothetical protein